MEKDSILTIDIGASKIRIQIVDREGGFGVEKFVSVVGMNPDNKTLKQLLVESIKPLTGEEKNHKVLAMSIGVPGRVCLDKNVIERMTNISNVKDLDVDRGLGDVFSLPTFLLNDADAGGLGEWWLGSGKGYKNLVYLTLSTGLGSCVIKNGELERGSELGHNAPLIVSGEQRICSCGNSNCPETLIGTKGLAEIYAGIFGLSVSDLSDEERHAISPKVKEGVKRGDEKCLAVQQKYTDYLTLFLKDIISNHKPEAIILGGGIAFGNEPLLKMVKDKIGVESKILPSQFENNVNLGLAKYAFDEIKKRAS